MLNCSNVTEKNAATKDCFISIDENWHYTDMNDRAVGMMGKSKEELIGKVIWGELPILIGTNLEKICRSAMETRTIQNIVTEWTSAKAWYNIIVFPFNQGIIVYWNDITEEKETEEALKNSEGRFQLLFESVTQAIWETDASGANVTDSPTWRSYTGQTYDETQGFGFLNAVHPDDREYVEKQWLECVKKKNNFNTEIRIKGPNGEWKWSNILAAPVFDTNGNVTRWVGIDIDITERKEAIESHVFHSWLLSNIHEAVLALDEQGVIVFCNKEFERLFGWKKQDVLELTRDDLINKHVSKESRENILNNPGEYLIENVDCICKDGSIRTVDITRTVMRGTEDARKGTILLLRDISARLEYEKNLLTKEQEYIEIIDSSTEGSFIQDLEKGEIYYSKAWRIRLGIDHLTPYEAVDALDIIVHPDDLENIQSSYLKAREQKIPRVKLIFRAKTLDSGYIWILEQSKIIYSQDGKPVKYYGTHIDITDRIQAEEALLKSEQQSKALIEELREINNSKNEFIARLSHELRNPLSAIMIGNSILKQKQKNADDSIKNTFDIIERQTLQLNRLVDDLLDVTRISQNNIEIKKERVECNELVRGVLADYHNLLAENGIALETEYGTYPLFMDADPVRLAQVLGNLLHNSAKFTKRGDKITIKIQSEQESSNAIITVNDTGIGVDPEFMPQLFEPFTQADRSLDRKNGGLGLGLAIVKGILTLHGGTIEAYSDGPGKGLKLTIRLPLSEESSESAMNQAKFDMDSCSLKILIIEDNEDLLEIMVDLLEYLGHEVIAASDGTEGIRKARHDLPGALICDIGLPGMNGYEVAEIFKNDDELKRVFRIALSGYAQPEDMERSKKAGFHRHLAKPVELETLKFALSEAYTHKEKN